MSLNFTSMDDEINMFSGAPEECARALDLAVSLIGDECAFGRFEALEAGPFVGAKIIYLTGHLKGRIVSKLTDDPTDFYIYPPEVYKG